MNSEQMLREFKVGMDKIDSESYKEIYDEQIFMFINRFISNLVNAGRKVFEENQVITDNLKSLIPNRPVQLIGTPDVSDPNKYDFNLLEAPDYWFYIRSSATSKLKNSNIGGKASTKVTQHDDLEVVLDDPHNKPKPYKVPIVFSRDTISGYSDGTFDILNLLLTYVKKPAVVDAATSCDLDEQIHYSIVEGAIDLAMDALGINKQEINTH